MLLLTGLKREGGGISSLFRLPEPGGPVGAPPMLVPRPLVDRLNPFISRLSLSRFFLPAAPRNFLNKQIVNFCLKKFTFVEIIGFCFILKF